jgi:glyoxylate reductase
MTPDSDAPPAAPTAHRFPGKPRVIVTRRLMPAVEARMRELFDVRLNADDRSLDRAALVAAMAAADVLVPTVTDRIDAGMFAEALDRAIRPKLALIARPLACLPTIPPT